jgi:hypothetical protein
LPRFKTPAGAVLTTKAASLCELIFDEGNICRFEENTTAAVDITRAQGSIGLQTGALAAVFSKLNALGSGGGSFGITTPTAVAGVRGTASNHAAFRFIRASGSIRRQRAGLLYHDNALMDHLAAGVGTRLVWGSGEESGY